MGKWHILREAGGGGGGEWADSSPERGHTISKGRLYPEPLIAQLSNQSLGGGI